MSNYSTWASEETEGYVYNGAGLRQKVQISYYIQRVAGTEKFNVAIEVECCDKYNEIEVSLEDFVEIAKKILAEYESMDKKTRRNLPHVVVRVVREVGIMLNGDWNVIYDENSKTWIGRVHGDLRTISSKFIEEMSHKLRLKGYYIHNWKIRYEPIQEFIVEIRRDERGVANKG